MTTFTESILAPLGHGVVRAPAEATVLVIDDDPAMRDILCHRRPAARIRPAVRRGRRRGPRLAEQSDVDLILLDLSLPGMPGLDVCRRLRGAGVEVRSSSCRRARTPWTWWSHSRSAPTTTSPNPSRSASSRHVSTPSCAASGPRSRRSARAAKFPGLIVDIGRHEVLRDGESVNLTPTEFDLLALLSASPGRVISRSEMIQKVWGQGADLDLRSVDAHVYRLRRKIEPTGSAADVHPRRARDRLSLRAPWPQRAAARAASVRERGDRPSQLTRAVATMHRRVDRLRGNVRRGPGSSTSTS